MKAILNIIGVITIGGLLYMFFVDDSFLIYLRDYVWIPFVDFLTNIGPGYW